MNFLKSTTFKIIAPPFLLFLIIIILALTIGGTFFSNSTDKKIKNIIETEHKNIFQVIDYTTNQLETSVKLFASVQSVIDGFSVCNKTNTKDSCTLVLGKEFSKINKNSHFNLSMYLTNGEKVYSNTTNEINSENLNSIIQKVSSSRNTVSGFSKTTNGESLISASPVIFNETIVGIVISSKPIEEIANYFHKTNGLNYLISNSNNESVYLSDKNIPNVSDILNNTENSEIFNIDKYIIKKISVNTLNDNINLFILFNTEIETKFIKNMLFYLLLFSILAFIFGGGIYIINIYKNVLSPIKKINNKISILSKGEITSKIKVNSKDALGKIIESINLLIQNQEKTSLFAKTIGEGKLDTEFTLISENDQMGNALLEMRDELLKAKIAEQKRKDEDEKRAWATRGHAEFGDILRQNNNDIQIFSANIIKNLVKYTNSNQGGLFFYNDSDENNKVLELVAAYAYDRKKYVDKEIKLGEGLVGTCAIEKETIYLTDVPDNYITITSGLGDANPRNILIVPLKVEEKLFGVLEIASFNLYEKYHIEFIEKLAESIASSLSTTKTNIMTAQLLEQSQQQQEEMKAQEEEMRQNMEEMQATQEQTQQQQEEMKAQEEELRQNLEELQATQEQTQQQQEEMKAQEEEMRQNMEEMLAVQEELSLKEKESEGVLKAIGNKLAFVEFDFDGNIKKVNDKFLVLFESDNEDDFINRNYLGFSDLRNNDDKLSEIKAQLQNDEIVSRDSKITLPNGKEILVNETFTPVIDFDDNVIKIIDILVSI